MPHAIMNFSARAPALGLAALEIISAYGGQRTADPEEFVFECDYLAAAAGLEISTLDGADDPGAMALELFTSSLDGRIVEALLGGELDVLSAELGVDAQALHDLVLTTATELLPGHSLELSEEDDGLHLRRYVRVQKVVTDPLTTCELRRARRVDPKAVAGDELGHDIFFLPARAPHARLEDASTACHLGLLTDRPALRAEIQRRLVYACGLTSRHAE